MNQVICLEILPNWSQSRNQSQIYRHLVLEFLFPEMQRNNFNLNNFIFTLKFSGKTNMFLGID